MLIGSYTVLLSFVHIHRLLMHVMIIHNYLKLQLYIISLPVFALEHIRFTHFVLLLYHHGIHGVVCALANVVVMHLRPMYGIT